MRAVPAQPPFSAALSGDAVILARAAMAADRTRPAGLVRMLWSAAATALDRLVPTARTGNAADLPREWFKYPPI